MTRANVSRAAAWAAVGILAAACGDDDATMMMGDAGEPGEDAGARDAGVDSGREDAGPGEDAGAPDGGPGDAGVMGDAGVRPMLACDAEKALFVASMAFTQHRLGIYDPAAGWTAAPGDVLSSSDAVAYSAGCGRPAVLSRDVGVVALQDPSLPFMQELEVDVDPEGDVTSNPQAVLEVAAGKLYVAPMNLNEVVVVDTTPMDGPEVTSRIDLSGFVQPGDADGVVEPMAMIQVEDRVFVALGNLSNFMPTGTSMLAVIDVTTDTLVDVDGTEDGVQAIELRNPNPFSGIVHDEPNGRLLVGNSEVLGELDGGIEGVDLATLRSTGLVVSESELGGELSGSGAFVLLPDGRIAAAIDPFGDSALLIVDPAAATITPMQLASDVSGVLLLPAGLLAWGSEGVRLFDSATGANITPGGPAAVPFPTAGFTPNTAATVR